MATSSSFSYAQAAKGQAPNVTTTATSTQSTSTSENHIADMKVAIKNQSAADDQDSASNDASAKDRAGDEASPAEHADSVSGQDNIPAAPTNNDTVSAPATSLNGSRRDDDDAATESSARRSDKSAVRSSSSSTRPDETELKKGQRKGRKGKAATNGESDKSKDKEAEKEKEQPKIELTEAPMPSVNIWTQRKEAQDAKGKPSSTPAASQSAGAGKADGSVASTETWGNSQESKKKSKTNESADSASVGVAQTGGVNGTKQPRKAATEDGRAEGETSKRSGARGSRTGDKAEALPPVGDAASWPTPETALKDDKRKPGEKTERTEQVEAHDEGAGHKSRKKEQWARMEFVPTVNFETPVPAMRGSRGGGRNGRGGRDVSTRGGGNAASTTVADRTADGSTVTTVKGGNDQREKSRDGAMPSRPTSVPPSTTRQTEPTRTRDARKAASRPKDAAASEHAGPRGDGRGERGGRGGYRGRGGHQNVSLHNQQGSFNPNGSAFAPQSLAPRHQQFTSPPLPQSNSFPQGFGSARSTGRGGGGGRQSTASNYSHRPNGNGNRPRPISTSGNMGYTWDSYPNMPMTAPAYPPQQAFDFHVRPVLTQQVDFYFSLENLCKDLHLRKNMDSQGFVLLSLIHGFQRVFQLCGPNLHLLRSAVSESTAIDYVIGKDGLERVRARHHWQKFVLPTDQRSEAAQTDGPEGFHVYSRDQQAVADGAAIDYPVSSPPLYANGTGFEAFPQTNGAYPAELNGQLSAAVPDFQPSGAFTGEQQDQVNGDLNGTAPATDTPEGQALTNGAHGESQVEALQS